MSVSLFKTIFIVFTASHAFPILVFLLRWRAHASQDRTIFVLLISSAISNLIIWWLLANDLSSVVVTNLYTIIDFVLLSVFYYQILYVKKIRPVLYISSSVFLTVAIVSALYEGIWVVNDYVWVLSSAILAMHSILYFCFIPHMISARYLDPHLFSNITLTASLLFYFLTSMIIFVFMDYVFSNLTATESRAFWSIHNIVDTLKNLGIALAFFLSGKRKTYITINQLANVVEKEGGLESLS